MDDEYDRWLTVKIAMALWQQEKLDRSDPGYAVSFATCSGIVTAYQAAQREYRLTVLGRI